MHTQSAVADPFAESKVQINLSVPGSTPNAQQKSTNLAEVPAGTKLIAIASNECMVENGRELSERVYNYDQEFENLDVQAYVWTTEKDLSLSEIQQLADQDPCIKGLANDGIATSTANLASTLPNDPLVGRQTQFTSVGGPETFSFFNDKSHGSIKPVVVAIIDSGITPTHPELANQLWHGASSEIGYNFMNPGSSPVDDFGHGTNVSGIIGAESNNGIGVTGMMGHNIQLMSLKVQNNFGVGSIANITSAIDYARANGADVINISMVGYGSNAALQSALQNAANANIFIAVAAGNDALTISTGSSSTYAVPAIYGSAISGMLTVGSVISNTNARSSFSNVSTTYVEIAAPGSSGMYFPAMPATYESKEGTSYSSPQVAAAGALVISFLRQHNVSYTAAMVENIITTAAYRSTSASAYFAQGRVLDLRGLKEYLQLTFIGAESGGFSDF